MSSALIFAIVILVILFIFLCIIIFNKINPKISKKKLKENSKECIIEFHNEQNETPYLIKKDLNGNPSNDDFRVVCCSDLHLATNECVFGLTLLERLIDKTKPDLLILLGDNVCGRKDTVIENKLIEIMEKRKLYYAFVLGNHDSEKMITEEIKNIPNLNREIYEKIRKKHRLFKFNGLSNSKYSVANLHNISLSGVGNYLLNIKNANGVIKTLYFFDSGDYVFGVKRKHIGSEKRCYDHIHDDQLDWYTKEVKKNPYDSIAFFHIPLKEYYRAYLLSLLPFYNFKKPFGNNYEKPCSSDVLDNTFRVFQKNKSTKLVVCGHDHKNDSCIKYKGIYLMYSQGLQYDGAYNRRKKNPKLFSLLYKLGIKCYVEGVSVFDLNKEKIDITPVYAEMEDIFYGLEKYYKKAWLEGTYFKNGL